MFVRPKGFGCKSAEQTNSDTGKNLKLISHAVRIYYSIGYNLFSDTIAEARTK